MSSETSAAEATDTRATFDETTVEQTTVIAILAALSLSHLLNDVMQSLLPAVYPLLKAKYSLSFFQVGLITFAFQVTASLLQPLVGLFTDRRPWAYTLLFGTMFTLLDLLGLAMAGSFVAILLAAALVGIGSSIFHPEASRVARLASGGRYGFAQSLFQVGGNAGQAIGPLLVALVVIPNGQGYAAWFALAAVIGIAILSRVGLWYRGHLAERHASGAVVPRLSPVARNRVILAVGVLVALTFSKNFYMAAFASYYNFFLIDRFAVSVQSAQVHL